MACAAFSPHVLAPIETPEEQALWLAQFQTNLLSSACIQDFCSTVCLPGNSPLGAACKQCLAQAGCAGTKACLDCLGENPATLQEFEPVYACTSQALPPSTTVSMIIGIVMGTLFVVALVLTILFLTHRLPAKWRLETDHRFFTRHEHSNAPH